jgi:hypothetical protein
LTTLKDGFLKGVDDHHDDPMDERLLTQGIAVCSFLYASGKYTFVRSSGKGPSEIGD